MKVSNLLIALIYINAFRLYPGFLSETQRYLVGGRLFDLLILMTITLFLASQYQRVVKDKSFFQYLFIPIFLFLPLALLATLGTADEGYIINLRDSFEYFRIILVGLVVYIFMMYGKDIEFKDWDSFFVISIIVYLAIVLVLVLGGSTASTIVNLFLDSKSKFISDSSLFLMRQSGFFVNPNWAGLFLNWCFLYFLFAYTGDRKIRAILLTLSAALIFMSGSRTALIVLFLIGSLAFFYKYPLRAISLSIISVLSVLLILTPAMSSFILELLPEHQKALAQSLLNYGSLYAVESFVERLGVWSYLIDQYISIKPIIGWGPIKEMVGLADNQYIKWLVWYGFLGTATIISFYFFILIQLFYEDSFKKNPKDEITDARVFIIFSFLALLLSCMTGQFFENTQLIFLWSMFVGFLLSKIRKQKEQMLVI